MSSPCEPDCPSPCEPECPSPCEVASVARRNCSKAVTIALNCLSASVVFSSFPLEISENQYTYSRRQAKAMAKQRITVYVQKRMVWYWDVPSFYYWESLVLVARHVNQSVKGALTCTPSVFTRHKCSYFHLLFHIFPFTAIFDTYLAAIAV